MTTLAKYLTLLTVAVLSVSCSSRDIDTTVTPQPGLSVDGCMAGFTITLDSGDDIRSRLASRAPSEGDYEIGTAAENYIDIDGKDFMILFFDKEDRYIGMLDDVLVIIESSDGSMKRYRVSGTVPVSVVDDAGQEFKMMMLANWRHDYPQPEKGSPLQEIASSIHAAYTFDYSDDQRVGRERPIPMFGVSNLIIGKEFDPGWETDLGTLHLLRAYAKVRVRAHGDGLPITSVTLTRGNTRGYRAPLGVSKQDDYVHGSYDRDYYRKPSVPADSEQQTDIPFIYNENNDIWTLYMPEFANLGLDADGRPDPRAPLAAELRSRIRVTFDGHVGEDYVDFKYYSAPPAYAGEDAREGYHFDLLRNTVYDFTLRKHSGSAEVDVEVDVQPYAEQVLRPGFGLMRDEMGDLMILPEKDVNGNDSLPEFFMDYLTAYGKDTIFDRFPVKSLVKGDYYAIHRGQDGEMANAEIWLKDIDGAHVLENFRDKDDNDENCSTRYVELYFGLDKYYFHKDRDGDRRLHHFHNHWTVVLDRKDYTVFKSPDNDQRYEVESFDAANPDEFYIVADPPEDADNYYFIKVTNGEITDEKVTIPKKS
ncbi:MAG: hypothetical protein K2I09_03850 [Duncaniella sp.]|nr:hypothetical protein [Duncaniella sp.]